MSGAAPQLILVAVLVLVNAAFSGSEMALVTLRESQLRRLEGQSASGATLARLAREPNRFLATIQIGITLAGFLASAAAAVSLAEPLEDLMSFFGSAARAVSILLVTIALSYLTLVLGELAPKRLAMQRAERWGLIAARPLAAVAAVTRPAVWLLSASTDLVVRLAGGDPTRQREEVTGEELRDMVASQRTFTPQQRMILDGAFEVSERTLQQVLRPRPDVYVLDSEQPAPEALLALAKTGFSRAPVASGRDLDQAVGLVHLRDLLGVDDRTAAEVAAPMRAFPESAGVLSVLHDMQTTRSQMVLVVDEHGAAAGIVTLEDLVEEIVGEIYDETDRDVVGAQRDADGTLRLSGRFPIHDLVDLEIEGIPEGPYSTVAGLVLDRLGRIPTAPGDTVTVGGHLLSVAAVGNRSIMEVTIRPADDDETDDETDDAAEDSADEHSADEHSADEHSADEHSADEHSADEHSADEHSADEHSADEHSADENQSQSTSDPAPAGPPGGGEGRGGG